MLGIQKKINDIIINGDISTNEATLEIILKAGDTRIKLDRIMSFSVNREYHKNYGDNVFLDCEMPLGDLVKIVYANREKLSFTVIEKRGPVEVTNRYRGLFLNDQEGLENEMFKRGTRDELNTDMGIGLFQLIDTQLETFMGKRKTGVMNGHTIKEILTCTVGSEWRKIIYPGDKLEKEFSMIPPHNTSTLKIFQMPSETRYLDLPQLIQRMEHGIYRGGVGMYLQNHIYPAPTEGKLKIKKYVRCAWIFPLYNTDKTNRKSRRTKIFLSSDNKDKELARTYAIDQTGSLRLIATIDDDFKLKNTTNTANVGSMDIRVDPTSTLLRSHKHDDSGHIEVSKSDYIDESDYAGPDSPKLIKHGRTANDFDYKTEAMKIEGRHVTVTWKFSVPDILFPGMLLDLYVESDGKVVTLNGVLQSVYTVIDGTLKESSSVLVIFLTDKGDYK